ncbi:MAG: hypothetical protein D3914_15165 [Candidatus Electrothrix sp. LOE2]|nr:hypothetical protein [Candidatus Electrothrix sp. LOE2]
MNVIETKYRIYADGTVVHEDEFEEYDHAQPYSDDYRTVSVPDEVIDFIVESAAAPVPQFITERAKRFYSESKIVNPKFALAF